MINLFYWTDKVHDNFTIFLLQFMNWYIVILFYVFGYILIKELLKLVEYKEKQKQVIINREIGGLKSQMNYQPKKREESQSPFSNIFIKEPEQEDEEFKEKAIDVVKRHKGKPHRIVLSMFFQIFLFITILYFLKSIETIPNHYALPLLSAILTFFTGLTRKTIIFNGVIAVIIGLFFANFSGNMNLFYLLYALYNFTSKTYTTIKEKHEMSKENLEGEVEEIKEEAEEEAKDNK